MSSQPMPRMLIGSKKSSSSRIALPVATARSKFGTSVGVPCCELGELLEPLWDVPLLGSRIPPSAEGFGCILLLERDIQKAARSIFNALALRGTFSCHIRHVGRVELYSPADFGQYAVLDAPPV
mmetsp:Transcript_60806/g.83483  ORF Transcript_60806/g.83483 Transcript_60806/m.83483 type:complete len:124 (-) Transcript_60806:26-397(-)|eukprot:CAMPEP_0185747032 /NCGR_PEP_ID=MMETSP1174-20130828/5717_1 /TAXON_ID=35687 /ORGANISM="Dictyocha speculum, Strain CCMP1381" /LENGTH=123 /DNA_ID=CAMNT_0028422053 /DNA_START=165 /DNA_END=536 /DNA_ORIENTATION=+